MSYRKRFFGLYLVLAAAAGALIAAAVALAVVPGKSSASQLRPGPAHVAAKAVPSARGTTVPALTGFAASFQDYASTAQAGFGGPDLIVRDCVEGGKGTAFCAYTVQGVCRGAMLTMQPITVKQAGKVGLSAPDCTARHALKWIGANG